MVTRLAGRIHRALLFTFEEFNQFCDRCLLDAEALLTRMIDRVRIRIG